MREIAPKELAQRLAAGEDLALLDVREPWERALCVLPGSLHIPMQEIPNAMTTLDPEKELVIYCHSGVRSLHAGRFLEQNGFRRVVNLAGGIDRWAREVEPSMPRY